VCPGRARTESDPLPVSNQPGTGQWHGIGDPMLPLIMSSGIVTVSDSKQHENLIAYLDGELSDQAAADVEKTLATNSAARENVEKMTRTWELLDLLPEVKASQNFTEKTLTVIQAQSTASTQTSSATDVQNDLQHSRIQTQLATVARHAAGFFVLFLIASIGFQSTYQSSRLPRPRNKLIQELPVIERLDEYQSTGSIEFLQALHESRLFHDKRNTSDTRRTQADRD